MKIDFKKSPGKTDWWIAIPLMLFILAIGFVFYYTIYLPSNPKLISENINSNTDTEPVVASETENNKSETTEITDEEAYSNPFMLHIRKALNGYLNGTNDGVEEGAIDSFDGGGLNCGLSKFDKAYYKSKFFLWDAGQNKYGGWEANIVFIDKPDKIFWVWVYQYHDGSQEYVLRGFCENGPADDLKEGFPEMIKAMIKDFKYSL